MLPTAGLTVDDLLLILRRRAGLVIVIVAVVSAATAGGALLLPNHYRSETLILVLPRRVPETYVKSTVTARIEDRLQSIAQEILSHTRLEQIIRDFDLYAAERRTQPIEAVVENMRRHIDVRVVKGDSFRVAYIGDNPQTVMRVTNGLAALFIEEQLRDREELADETNHFLQAQLADARQRLGEHEKKLEQYRSRFSGELPSQLASNLQVIQNLQLQIQSLTDSAGRDDDRRTLLQRELRAAERELESERRRRRHLTRHRAVPTAAAPRQLWNRRAASLPRWNSAWPRTSRPPADAALRCVRSNRGGSRSGDREQCRSTSAPRRIRRHACGGRGSRICGSSWNSSIAVAFKRAEESGCGNRSTLRTADRTGSGARIRAGRTDSRLFDPPGRVPDAAGEAGGVEDRRQPGKASDWRAVQTPRPGPAPPRSPPAPPRWLINLAGIAAGLAFALALVLCLEYRDRTLNSDEEVKHELLLPVSAVVPLVESDEERRTHLRRRVPGDRCRRWSRHPVCSHRHLLLPAVRSPCSNLHPADCAFSTSPVAAAGRDAVAGRSADPRSAAAGARAVQQLAAALHNAQALNGAKVVMVASAVGGEGKSLTAANLALTLAESYQRRVLLIDADLRKPSLDRLLAEPPRRTTTSSPIRHGRGGRTSVS